MLSRWFILLGPLSVTVAQFFVSPIVQFFVTKLIFSEPLSEKEIRLGSIYVAVHSFIQSWLILLVVSLIYARFIRGIAGFAAWGIVVTCIILILVAFIKSKELIILRDFDESSRIKIGEFRAQLKSRWNKLRILVVIISWIPAILIFLGLYQK